MLLKNAQYTEFPIFKIITIIRENSIRSNFDLQQRRHRPAYDLNFKSTYFKWIACVCLHFLKFMIQFGRCCLWMGCLFKRWIQASRETECIYQPRFQTHIDNCQINKFSIKLIVALSTIENITVLFARYPIHRLLARHCDFSAKSATHYFNTIHMFPIKLSLHTNCLDIIIRKMIYYARKFKIYVFTALTGD